MTPLGPVAQRWAYAGALTTLFLASTNVTAVGDDAYRALLDAWREALGRSISWVFLASGALAAVAWVATWRLPPLHLESAEPPGPDGSLS